MKFTSYIYLSLYLSLIYRWTQHCSEQHCSALYLTIFRLSESHRWPIAVGCHPSFIVRRPSCVIWKSSSICLGILKIFWIYSKDEHGSLYQNCKFHYAPPSPSSGGPVLGHVVKLHYLFENLLINSRVLGANHPT